MNHNKFKFSYQSSKAFGLEKLKHTIQDITIPVDLAQLSQIDMHPIIAKIKNLIKIWSWCRQTQYVIIWIINSLLSPQLIYRLTLLPNPTPQTLNSSPAPSATYMHQRTGSAMFQVMACRLFGAKPLPEPNLAYCQLNTWEQTAVKFGLYFWHFHLKPGKSEGFDSCDRASNLKLDSNCQFFSPCDLEIWWMTSTNNGTLLLYYVKLCALSQIHRRIQTGVTVRKRPIWVKIEDFLSHMTLKFDRWPWKEIGHLFYTTLSLVHHFKAVGEIGQNRQFLSCMTLKFDGWPWKTIGHLSCAASSFVYHFVAIGEFKLKL